MFIVNFLSLVTCLSRHESRDIPVFSFWCAFDVKNDKVDWLEEVVNSDLIISFFWSPRWWSVTKENNTTVEAD